MQTSVGLEMMTRAFDGVVNLAMESRVVVRKRPLIDVAALARWGFQLRGRPVCRRHVFVVAGPIRMHLRAEAGIGVSLRGVRMILGQPLLVRLEELIRAMKRRVADELLA